jgi:hypothetical protein
MASHTNLKLPPITGVLMHKHVSYKVCRHIYDPASLNYWLVRLDTATKQKREYTFCTDIGLLYSPHTLILTETACFSWYKHHTNFKTLQQIILMLSHNESSPTMFTERTKTESPRMALRSHQFYLNRSYGRGVGTGCSRLTLDSPPYIRRRECKL